MECPRCNIEYVYEDGLYCPDCKEKKVDFDKKMERLHRKVIDYSKPGYSEHMMREVMKVIKT